MRCPVAGNEKAWSEIFFHCCEGFCCDPSRVLKLGVHLSAAVLGLRYAFTHSCKSFVWSMLGPERWNNNKKVCFQCPPVSNCSVELGFVVVVVVVVLALPRQAGTLRHCLFAPLPGGFSRLYRHVELSPKQVSCTQPFWLNASREQTALFIDYFLESCWRTHIKYMCSASHTCRWMYLSLLMSHAAPPQTYSGAFFYIDTECNRNMCSESLTRVNLDVLLVWLIEKHYCWVYQMEAWWWPVSLLKTSHNQIRSLHLNANMIVASSSNSFLPQMAHLFSIYGSEY